MKIKKITHEAAWDSNLHIFFSWDARRSKCTYSTPNKFTGCTLIGTIFWALGVCTYLGPFSWFSFAFNKKKGVRNYWNLLFNGWGCDAYLATAHPKGPVHLFGGGGLVRWWQWVGLG